MKNLKTIKAAQRVAGLTALVVIMLALGGCVFDADNGGSTHTHQWSDWRSNASQHWKECTICGEVSSRASHAGSPYCSVCDYQTGSAASYSLNGVWGRGYNERITISGSTGTVTQLATYSAYALLVQNAIDKGYYKVGSQELWNLSNSSGGRTWTGRKISFQFNTSSPNVCIGTSWNSITIVLSADGQSFECSGTSGTGAFSQTYYRQTEIYSLDGVWGRGYNERITISGSTGTVTQLATYSAYALLVQNAIDKGYYKVGSQELWNLSNSSGGRTWTGRKISFQFNTSSPNVCIGTSWNSITIVLSADGQSFECSGTSGTGAFSQTYYRQ